MRITTEFTAWCQFPGCNVWDSLDGRTKTQAEQDAKAMGYREVNGVTLCPRHSGVKPKQRKSEVGETVNIWDLHKASPEKFDADGRFIS